MRSSDRRWHCTCKEHPLDLRHTQHSCRIAEPLELHSCSGFPLISGLCSAYTEKRRSYLLLGTKSLNSRTWEESLERTMWPANWPGENQKGKSGGSFSWNSAWILKQEDHHQPWCPKQDQEPGRRRENGSYMPDASHVVSWASGGTQIMGAGTFVEVRGPPVPEPGDRGHASPTFLRGRSLGGQHCPPPSCKSRAGAERCQQELRFAAPHLPKAYSLRGATLPQPPKTTPC